MDTKHVENAFHLARQQYADIGVDVHEAMETLRGTSVSIHCWQGDDVGGFENPGAELSGGGIEVTGNYPGKARTVEELRGDLRKALSLIPGASRLNLHACYLENKGRFVDRNEIGVEHFQGWIDWAKDNGLGMDFNPTFFSHPKAVDGFTLAHSDEGVRRFWIEHGIAARKIAAEMGRQLGTPCVNNIWIPDGWKDMPADRLTPRLRLRDSLDAIFAEQFDNAHLLDSVESKLFGIGSESYVVGSHEFYMGYAAAHGKLLCLDTGHFHPTEIISDKISALLCFLEEILLHVSRGVRWDSDHVAILSDELVAIAQEIVRGGFLQRVHIGLDFFDASINRVAAWVIGTRCVLKALLGALLEPVDTLKAMEARGDLTGRLAMMEELKTYPAGGVWDYYCLQQDVPAGPVWLDEVRTYEQDVLAKRA